MTLPQIGGTDARANVLRVARDGEAIGLDSLWVLDRLLRPLAPISIVPGVPPAPLDSFYANVADPIETLSFAAAVTERIALGTSVVNALLHQPVSLGKRFATLDQLSGGRVIAGLGQGWMPEEFAAAAVPPSRKGEGMAEFVAALRAVWGPDPVEIAEGRYRIPRSEIGPKPVRPDGIPIVIGCYAHSAAARAGRIADGLNPLADDWDALVAQIDIFRSSARAAGRIPDDLPIIARANATLRDQPSAGARPLFVGTVSDLASDARRLQSLDIHHVFFSLGGPIDVQLAVMADLRHRLG